jgi:alpha-ribazole phosphatase
MDIWLIRHTTPKVDKGICYGQLDLDVAESFQQESNHIKEHLKDKQFNKVFSSPLLRCHKLANYLFPSDEINYDSLLKEIDFGDWEGKASKAIPRDEMEQWTADYVNNPAPGGESLGQLIQRTDTFLTGLDCCSDDAIAIVTHSGIIRAFLVKYLQIPATKVFSLDLSFGCMITITIHSDDYQQVKFIKG